MIELTNVSKTYKTPNGDVNAITNIDLRVEAGKIFGVIGKSGAGKSTLIRCVNLLERPTSGNVRINQQDLTTLSKEELGKARHQIGMIFQHFNLLSSRTVYDNIALPLELIGVAKEKIATRVHALLELTELTDKKNNYPAQLSGGQKQRVAIARALATEPKILLCDEATSSLDPQTTQTILALLKQINQKLGLTILLITHEMDVIKAICDDVMLLDKGKMIQQAEVTEFFTHPKSTLAKQLVQNALKQTLPLPIQEKLIGSHVKNTNPLLRIIFHGKAADEPLMAHLMQELGIKLNILQANIEFLKNTKLGIMVVELISGHEKLSEAIAYLEKNKVDVEIMGYIAQNVN